MKLLRNYLDLLEPHFEKDGKLNKYYAMYEMVDTFLFTPADVTRSGPHIRDAIDLKRSMVFVVIALLPTFFFGTYNVGLQSAISEIGSLAAFKIDFLNHMLEGLKTVLPLYIVVFIVGGLWETVFAIVRKHEVNEGFLVTGFLIPLVMPPSVPLWMLAIATTFGVVIGKEIFGGTGFNIFNPALVARAFLFFAYPGAMSGDKVWIVDGVTSATPLLQVSSQSGLDPVSLLDPIRFSWMDMFYGYIPGSIGETSTLAILIGAIFLLITRIASWRVMAGTTLGMVLTTFLLKYFGNTIGSTNSMMYLPAEYHFVMGGFAFGMVFMATDPVSCAQTNTGRWYYGLLIGFMCVIIRSINPAYPEGMMLSILFCNAFAPLFDYFVMQANIKRRQRRFV